MILSISKITSRIFALMTITLFILATLFITFSYIENVKAMQDSVNTNLAKSAKKLSEIFSYPGLEKLRTKYTRSEEALTTDIVEETLPGIKNLDYINHFGETVWIELYPERSNDSPLIFNQKEIMDPAEAEKFTSKTAQPEFPVSEWIFNRNPQIVILCKAALTDNSGKHIGNIIVSKDFAGYLANAKERLFLHISLAVVVFTLIGLILNRVIKRVFRQEVIANNKMHEYDRQTIQKNKEINKLTKVFSKTDSLLLLTDAEGTIEWINQMEHEKGNFESSQLKSFVVKKVSEVSYYPKIKDVINQVVETGLKCSYESKSYTRTRKEHWSSTSITPIFGDEGELENLLFIDTDITDLKNAEMEIEKLAKFPQENTRPVLRVDFSGLVLYSNDSGQTLLQSWKAKVGEAIKNKTILHTVQKVVVTKEEKEVNVEIDNRIYNLRFYPIEKENYINIYGEDITELHFAERERNQKAQELQKVNMNMTDSITYARKIQESIIPNEDDIRKYFKDAFVISKPKGIVSGDFFWMHEITKDKEYLVASVDCTGHGVPGAMMSIVAHGLLNEIVQKQKITEPSEILEKLNQEIIKTLKQTSDKSSDGMDISLIHLNLDTRVINFAGAYRPLVWMNGKLNIFKGNRYPIGGLQHDNNRQFTSHKFKVGKGDALYMFSDGFADQFGGAENKKFLFRNFAAMIQENHQFSMQAQSHIYTQTLEKWKGDTEQIDDISLMGIRL